MTVNGTKVLFRDALWSGEILPFCHKCSFNGKISPLQNLLKQIFPVEMTLYLTIHRDRKQVLSVLGSTGNLMKNNSAVILNEVKNLPWPETPLETSGDPSVASLLQDDAETFMMTQELKVLFIYPGINTGFLNPGLSAIH